MYMGEHQHSEGSVWDIHFYVKLLGARRYCNAARKEAEDDLFFR
jgi:hypothetical protein